VTLAREADGWYVAISCAEVPVKPLPLTGQQTGIDLGLESFATLADGSQIANPRIFRVAERTLRRAQRRVARREKGSHRRRKAVRLLARAHLKVKRQRADFHHKTALALVRQYDTISHEDLQTANMVKNHYLAKSISDAGWSAFLSILSCKAAAAGKTVVAVPPASTSQACSGCSVLVHKGFPSAGIPARTVAPACIATTTLPATSCAWEKNDVGPGRPFRRERGPLGRA
jgi:putative transposase